MQLILGLAESPSGGIGTLISPLLIHTVIWALFIIWAGLVLLIPPRKDEDEDLDEQDLAEEEIETAGAKAAGILLYLIALLVVIFASVHREPLALAAAGALCLAGLVIAYMVRMQVRAARIAIGAAILGAILGGVVIVQYIHRNLWEAREQRAVDALLKIYEAESKYYKRVGIIGNFKMIAMPEFGGPRLDGNFANDYIFEIRPDVRLDWVVTARPESPFPWVLAHFYMDSSRTIRYARGKPADITSTPWRGPTRSEKR